MNKCEISGCRVTIAKRKTPGRTPSRCEEHSTTCIEWGCEGYALSRRCEKHKARYRKAQETPENERKAQVTWAMQLLEDEGFALIPKSGEVEFATEVLEQYGYTVTRAAYDLPGVATTVREEPVYTPPENDNPYALDGVVGQEEPYKW